MDVRRITPGGRGFLILNAHPAGCAAVVDRMWSEAAPPSVPIRRRPVALVIGSSGGYGLAATLVGLRQHGIRGVGLSLETAATERRTASAGWYRTVRAAELAAANANDFSFLNIDAFTVQAKQAAVRELTERYGQVEYLIYSLAAPRRTDPETGQTYRSVIKATGCDYSVKTMSFTEQGSVVATATVPKATDAELTATVEVMGGSDWELWVKTLQQHDLIAANFTTVALSYIGSELLRPVYRGGTLGAAKLHLEDTALRLRAMIPMPRSYAVVAGAAVTQASTAIPGSPLYLSILSAITDDAQRSTVAHAADMWNQITGDAVTTLDRQGRIRIDDWEMDSAVQAEVSLRWNGVETANLADLADPDRFRADHHELYGWSVPGVDYSSPVQPSSAWPRSSSSP